VNITSDNRKYDYSNLVNEDRDDFKYIVGLVKEGTKIIDLGCGNGSLMQKLIKEKNVTASGMELSHSGVEVSRNKGLNVIQGRIDEKLPYKDNEFDYAICHITIQMVVYPEVLLREMRRISKGFLIISFPNFAFYKNRIDILLKGRMPKPMLFRYKWYNTGHLHQLSVKDFYELIEDVGGLKHEKMVHQQFSNPVKNFISNAWPNLFQVLTVHLLRKI
jgi:methionine biosynthesis protein MetW